MGHGRRHFDNIPKYMGHEQKSRLALFAKDRQIWRLQSQLADAMSTLEFIVAVADGEVGGPDAPWQVETILEALTPKVRKAIADRHNNRDFVIVDQ